MAEKTVETTAKKTAPKKVTVKKSSVKKSVKSSLSEEFAVIETGGKQYMVSVGDVVDVELLGEHEEGDKIEFDKVLLVDDGKDATIGMPYIKGAKVKATYQGLKKGKKLTILRFKAKSNRDRKLGHRQKYSRVKIESI
jgi:large subunit ribosomal protein L21